MATKKAVATGETKMRSFRLSDETISNLQAFADASGAATGVKVTLSDAIRMLAHRERSRALKPANAKK